MVTRLVGGAGLVILVGCTARPIDEAALLGQVPLTGVDPDTVGGGGPPVPMGPSGGSSGGIDPPFDDAGSGGGIDPGVASMYLVEIQPIWEAHCVECHGPGGQRPTLTPATVSWPQLRDPPGPGGPRPDNPQYVAPFQPTGSYLMVKLTGANISSNTRMPPPPADALSSGQLRRITLWISNGAPP